MLKGHKVHRTGKEDRTPLVQAPELCGPDSHVMAARMRILERREAASQTPGCCPSPVQSYDWEAESKDYHAVERIEKRKNRGGATFRPDDAC